ncbi:MAG: hypothetical protein USCGTAYLOR_01956 [Chromatiales bacterium USCg_Taylor]|nr:MAG: hypothetical protein USCGTAYLOR_01956 [Chromatiales bacterium USCg_Taylor]
MKVFISWSGDRSRAVADVLRRWFPSVLQAVRPYFSPDDVAKGARWSAEIAKELEASRIGLLVITPENQEAPWLLFEAGALAKNLERSKVCPILFGAMEPTASNWCPGSPNWGFPRLPCEPCRSGRSSPTL